MFVDADLAAYVVVAFMDLAVLMVLGDVVVIVAPAIGKTCDTTAAIAAD